MRVVHIESGLGNQMLSFCELIAQKSIFPNEKYYVETLVYEFPEASTVINQWRGYELERVFKVSTSNVKELFGDSQWDEIISDIRNSQFWSKNWNWPVYFTKAFSKQGLELHNMRGDFEEKAMQENKTFRGKLRKKRGYQLFQKTWLYSNLRTWKNNRCSITNSDLEYLFYSGRENILTGQKLSFMYKNNNIEVIDEEIRKTFLFPAVEDFKNMKFLSDIKDIESVAIHVRRGDLLGLNGRYYKGGYFRRAVKYIKAQIKHPVFCFFCDPGSTDWCKNNEKTFGLDLKKDEVIFVDWNKGDESFRDMQLMSRCKHNIITISSFGWWGSYLNSNPNKITISPEIRINTRIHM